MILIVQGLDFPIGSIAPLLTFQLDFRSGPGPPVQVRSVAWTADDSMLVSTGADGAVYEYYASCHSKRKVTHFQTADLEQRPKVAEHPLNN